MPSDSVPLSAFAVKSTNTIVLNVDPEILTWVSAHSGTVKVAVRRSTGQIVFANATSTNPTAGTVTYTSALLMGDCTVVTSLLKQGLPIVTHWKASLNGGRGGQQAGATDGIQTLDLDVVSGELVGAGSYTNANPVDPNWKDADHPEAGPYMFKSNVYALFDDGSGQHVNAAVPAFERYIGENYAISAPTSLAAIWLSDRVRAVTGFPIAHRNGTEAFDPGSPAGRKLADDLPVFQVVHAYIVDPVDQSPAGNEDSLCTYAMPPGWTSQASNGTYPLLFNAQYDIHSRGTFRWKSDTDSWAEVVFTTLGQLYNQTPPRRVVGSFWNGGGAVGTYTMHPSAYDNAAKLIADATTLLKVDPERVVFVGGSRGGITALEMGSNPYDHPYTAKFINAYSPEVRIGAATQYSNPSYPGGLGATPIVVGWHDAWKSSWVYPGTTMTGLQATMLNQFNTTDPAVIDAQYAIDSSLFRSGLASEGTFVIVRYGTHDHFHAYEHMVHYYDHLVNDGVPIQLEVFYRFGHNSPRDTYPSCTDLLNMVFDDVNPLTTKVNHFGRDADDYNDYRPLTEPLAHIPLVYETPLAVGSGQTHTWSFVGEPGGRFEVRSLYMGSGWDRGDAPPTAPLITRLTGTLAPTPFGGSNPTFGSATYLRTGAPDVGWWWYEVLYSPDGDTSYEQILGSCVLAGGSCSGEFYGVSAPTWTLGQPLVLVGPSEDDGQDDESRTGGLAEDDQIP